MRVLRDCLFALIAVTGLSAVAFAEDGDEAVRARLRESLRAHLPGLPAIDAIVRSPIAGVWEIRVGAVVFYADASGRYVLQGEVRDLQTQRNLTKERVDESAAIAFDDLPLRDALVTRKGNAGAHSIAVFADVNCGYCKALEKELAKLGDVTVYTFPVAMLGADSRKKSAAILCAKSPEKAWRDWMSRGARAPAAKCDTSALARNEAYAKRHLLRVTPTILFADGSRHEGIIDATQLKNKLSEKVAATNAAAGG